MHRLRTIRPAARAVAFLLATLLCFSITSDAYGFDPCPHHGVPERASVVAPAPMPMSGMAHHAGSHHSGPHHSGQHEKGAHGVCTCMGACSTAAAVPVPHAPTLVVAVITAPISMDAAVPDIAYISFHLDLLPYGIAPPAAR